MLGFSAGCLAVCAGSYPMRGCKCEVLLLCLRSCRAFAGAVAPIAPATAPNFTSPPFLGAGKGCQLSYVRSRGAEWASAVHVCCGMLLRSRVALLAGLVQLRGSAELRRCGLIPLPYHTPSRSDAQLQLPIPLYFSDSLLVGLKHYSALQLLSLRCGLLFRANYYGLGGGRRIHCAPSCPKAQLYAACTL